MIPQTELIWQEQSWQQAMQDCITSGDELCRLLGLDPQQLATDCNPGFPLKVPRAMLGRMQRGNANDPVLLQVLARNQEHLPQPGALDDPLQEAHFSPLPGLVHKYKNRLLVPFTGTCAMHCRYCFRRHFDYSSHNGGKEAWPKLFAYIRSQPQIDELILSGGDPLAAPDRLLQSFTTKLLEQTRVERIRVHSRLPVFIPQRITEELISWMRLARSPVMVLHINHPAELSEPLADAVSKLSQAGIRVLNQAVLLKGVNDSAEVQAQLCRRLFDMQIQPYYLHLLDPVRGAMHFEVAPGEAETIYNGMKAALSGYMLPALVREQPGEVSKTRIW